MPKAPSSSAKKILIVEDEKPMARALELKLTHEGFSVQSAGNGEEGLALLEKGQFDLMLLDIVMPKMDGFELLRRIHDKSQRPKVVVLSNLSQENDQKKAKEFGVDGFFVKSNTPITTIVNEVKKLVT